MRSPGRGDSASQSHANTSEVGLVHVGCDDELTLLIGQFARLCANFSVNHSSVWPDVTKAITRSNLSNTLKYVPRQDGAVNLRAAPDGPNFAGHYTVVTWGCGTECQMHAILDGRTGQFISFGYGSSMGLRYTLK